MSSYPSGRKPATDVGLLEAQEVAAAKGDSEVRIVVTYPVLNMQSR